MHDTEKKKSFYGRLYGKYTLYTSLQKALKDELGKDMKNNEEIQTYIMGKQPDIKVYRNFVSLDTRSREIRNKPKIEHTKVKPIVNIIIRKYQSSVGSEYFISCEDELGYLYGFTRLLLPIAGQGTKAKVKGLGDNIAMIRELHVYGQVK